MGPARKWNRVFCSSFSLDFSSDLVSVLDDVFVSDFCERSVSTEPSECVMVFSLTSSLVSVFVSVLEDSLLSSFSECRVSTMPVQAIVLTTALSPVGGQLMNTSIPESSLILNPSIQNSHETC